MLETGNNISSSQHLSIRIFADGFSFYIHTTDQRLIGSRSFTWTKDKQEDGLQKPDDRAQANRLQQVLADNKILPSAFSSVNILMATPSTRIPLDGFRKEEAEVLYRLVYPKSKGQRILYNVLPYLEIVELFALEPALAELLTGMFPAAHFYGQHTLLLERLARRTPAVASRKQLFVYADNSRMSVFALEGRSLHFANSYPATNLADITYFLLYIWKTLELQAETDECILLGNGIVPHQDIASSLRRYLRNVTVPSPSQLFNVTGIPTNLQPPPLDVYPLILNATYPL